MKKISFVVILIALLGFNSHKYYVSTSLYNFNEDSNSLQITMKIFKDDFTNLINKKEGIELDKVEDLNSTKIKSKISKYLFSNLSLFFDNNEYKAVYLGAKEDTEMFTFFLEIENLPSYKLIKLKNTVLFEMFNKQQNIVHFKKGTKKRSFVLRKDKGFATFEF